MPPANPLAHILAPQIMARARDIEAELGPPQVGYLAQQNVGFEKTPYDPRGLMDKPADKSFDSRTPGGHMLEGIGIMQRSGDPIAQKVARAFLNSGAGKTAGTQGSYRTPQAGQAIDAKGKRPSMAMLMPMPNQSEPIGWTERGEAIYATPPAAPSYAERHTAASDPRRPLKLKKGAAVGIDETGESVDPKGRKLGYLASPTAPMGTVIGRGGVRGDTGEVYPGRELPMKDLARRAPEGAMAPTDAYGAGALQHLYAPHLKAWQDNFQDTGREGFPAGYFNGMTPEKRKEIEDGVQRLRDMERGQPA